MGSRTRKVHRAPRARETEHLTGHSDCDPQQLLLTPLCTASLASPASTASPASPASPASLASDNQALNLIREWNVENALDFESKPGIREEQHFFHPCNSHGRDQEEVKGLRPEGVNGVSELASVVSSLHAEGLFQCFGHSCSGLTLFCPQTG